MWQKTLLFLLYIPLCLYLYTQHCHYSIISSNFTFHYVYIYIYYELGEDCYYPTLHSTMFIFIWGWLCLCSAWGCSLHSTMFIFILCFPFGQEEKRSLYIPLCLYLYLSVVYRASDGSALHSTMFIFICPLSLPS